MISMAISKIVILFLRLIKKNCHIYVYKLTTTISLMKNFLIIRMQLGIFEQLSKLIKSLIYNNTKKIFSSWNKMLTRENFHLFFKNGVHIIMHVVYF